MSESTIGIPYTIQSENTKFFVVSTREDKDGQEVDTTKPPAGGSIPPNSILSIDPAIRGPVNPNVHIRGASGLFISLKGEKENTKLTWAKEAYSWTISLIAPEAYVIIPGNGADLYWFDEFGVGVGDHVEVRAGRDIKPPQNQWSVTPAIF